VNKRDQWLLTNHNDERLYQGLWQFPWIWKKPLEGRSPLRPLLRSPLRPPLQNKSGLEELAGRFNLGSLPTRKIHSLRHSVTFRSISTDCYHLELPDDHDWEEAGGTHSNASSFLELQDDQDGDEADAQCEGKGSIRWVAWKDLAAEALPGYQKKIVGVLAEKEGRGGPAPRHKP
jgi:hypothetical protein